MLYLHETVDCNSLDVEEEMENVFEDQMEYEGYSQQEIDSMIYYATADFDIDDYSGDFLKPAKVEEYYNNLMNFVDTSSSYSIFESDLDNLVDSIDANLTCKDWNFMRVTTSIALNSAYLWKPTSWGGLDTEYACSPFNGGIENRTSCKEAVIAADISAAASYIMGMGFGLIVPGTNAAIATMIAYGAGFSSGMAALTNCP